jgi:hypothetical protein
MWCWTDHFPTGGRGRDVSLGVIIPIGTLFVGATGVVWGVWQNISGLRAKKAAQRALARNAELKETLQEISFSLGTEQFGKEMTSVAKLLRETLEKSGLTKNELHLIDQGLNQSNKAGERRYIEELVNTPH